MVIEEYRESDTPPFQNPSTVEQRLNYKRHRDKRPASISQFLVLSFTQIMRRVNMCNTSIHSPHPSQVFSSLETLSPPPTPMAKRARCVALTSPMPMFFPTSQSLLRQNAQQDAPYSSAERDQSRLLTSSSSLGYAPLLQRRQRSNNDHSSKSKIILSQALLRQIPPPPFSSLLDMKSMESSIPREASRRMNSFESNVSAASVQNSEARKAEPKAAAGNQQKKPPVSKRMNSFESHVSTSTQNSETTNPRKKLERMSSGGNSHQEKLPAFHRSGMHRNSATRRNSYVARTA